MEHIHFIGIGGTGLSAIAKVLLEQGYKVSGSDLVISDLSESVRAAGGTVFQGHKAEHVRGVDLVVRSSAIPEDNPEIMAAQGADIPVMKRAEFLGRLMEGKNVIAISGSHGKTTTTSLISWILTALGKDPSYIVGSIVENLGSNAHAGAGSDFVIEADEYDHMFLGLKPHLTVVTNVEHDHPDIFPTKESFETAFQLFVEQLQPGGTLILCGEDQGAKRLARHIKKDQNLVSYGFDVSENEYAANNIHYHPGGGSEFDLIVKGTRAFKISLQLTGEHNVLNAVAAFAAADQLSLHHGKIVRAISEFLGSERRFDIRGEYQGIVLIDDYAHHPTEIRATLAAAQSVYPTQRIIAVWQPHTFSRTNTMYSDFTKAFGNADQVVVTEVYAAREKKPSGFSLPDLVEEIEGDHAIFIPSKSSVIDYLKKALQPNDVLLVFSAGDAIEINEALEEHYSSKVPN